MIYNRISCDSCLVCCVGKSGYAVDPAIVCMFRSVFACRLGSTSVERCQFYRGGAAEISVELSRKA